jgi:hypothetical protein
VTPAEIKIEFQKPEVRKTFNQTVVKDAFVVGYQMMRDCAIPKSGEQLDVQLTDDMKRIMTFTLEQLPNLTLMHVKELSNLGFWLDFESNTIYYRIW